MFKRHQETFSVTFLQSSEFIEELLNGTVADGDKNLYILGTEELADKLGLTSYMIDGYCVGVLH